MYTLPALRHRHFGNIQVLRMSTLAGKVEPSRSLLLDHGQIAE